MQAADDRNVMCPRIWIWSVAALLLGTLIGFGVSRSSNAAPLRSEHSQPALKLPQQPVVVTAAGKLFHDPACTHIHGKPERMSALDAVSQGYAPCTRCMRSALQR